VSTPFAPVAGPLARAFDRFGSGAAPFGPLVGSYCSLGLWAAGLCLLAVASCDSFGVDLCLSVAVAYCSFGVVAADLCLLVAVPYCSFGVGLCWSVVAPYCSFVVVSAELCSLAVARDLSVVGAVPFVPYCSAVSFARLLDPSFEVAPFAHPAGSGWALAAACGPFAGSVVNSHFDRRRSDVALAVPSLGDVLAAAAASPVAAAAAVEVVRDFDYTQGNCHGRS